MGLVTVTAPQAASAPAVNPPKVDNEAILADQKCFVATMARGDKEVGLALSKKGIFLIDRIFFVFDLFREAEISAGSSRDRLWSPQRPHT